MYLFLGLNIDCIQKNKYETFVTNINSLIKQHRHSEVEEVYAINNKFCKILLNSAHISD